MEMTGERHISAPRQKVWEALNDPAVLKSAIPGCESLEKISENELKATASVRIGPIAARFAGKVLLSDLDPPNSYTISGEGQGGVAGFAKGGATVHLADAGPDTLLQYDVKAQVGGKIAQLGARLIDASAKQMADNFFDRFAASVGGVPEVAEAGPRGHEAVARETLAREAGERARAPAEPLGMPLVVWIAGVVCIVIIILVLGSYL
ncbi:MAG: SRPBCC family protein [Acetobacteraceae bacterium]